MTVQIPDLPIWLMAIVTYVAIGLIPAIKYAKRLILSIKYEFEKAAYREIYPKGFKPFFPVIFFPIILPIVLVSGLFICLFCLGRLLFTETKKP